MVGKLTRLLAQAEKTRMDMIHTVMLEARRDELHRARIESRDDKRILDLGTGTGTK